MSGVRTGDEVDAERRGGQPAAGINPATDVLFDIVNIWRHARSQRP
jgi:hypothetical protein